MLANLLAIVVGLGSLAFYLAAFILPEVHRRSDFFWSGVGMFYAVVLWYCARQINGAVLLGQTASVALLLWLGYQTLLLRRETTPAAQQTPIRFGKSERSRTASRPIAKDYEFVEDGVEDAVDTEPEPDSPILIKPAADEFALKMVVPAAVPKPTIEENAQEEPPSKDIPAPSKPTKTPEKPGPFAAVGIFVGWLRDVVTPKKQAPKPMIDLPPRPPSIPKPDAAPETAAKSVAPDASQTETTTETTTEDSDVSSTSLVNADPEAVTKNTASDTVPSAVSANIQQDDDEDSNWPDDEFWD